MKILLLVLKHSFIVMLFILFWAVGLPILMSYPSDILVLFGFILIPVSIAGFILYVYKTIKHYLTF